jgi:hypothetical protein
VFKEWAEHRVFASFVFAPERATTSCTSVSSELASTDWSVVTLKFATPPHDGSVAKMAMSGRRWRRMLSG